MPEKNIITFHNRDAPFNKDVIVSVYSTMVPSVGAFISIRKQTWSVVSVTYAVDDADNLAAKQMHAHVNLEKINADI